MELAMIQDKTIPLTELAPEYMDRGTYFGDGAYEVIRSYNGKLFAFDDHIARFDRSLKEIKIDSVDIQSLKNKVLAAFKAANIPDAKIYFHITRGSHMRNHLAGNGLEPNFFMTISALTDNPEEKSAGISVSTFPDWRWKRCDIKSLNLLANVMAKLDADKKGCAEAILVDDDGFITEGSASAFFMIDHKQIITRPLGNDILPSITRKFVEQIAPAAGLTVTEKPMTVDQAKNADELFIAVTTKDIVPVTKFDNQTISNGQAGTYTTALINEFQNLIKNS